MFIAMNLLATLCFLVNKTTIITGPNDDVIVPADSVQTSTVKPVDRRVGIWNKKKQMSPRSWRRHAAFSRDIQSD